MGGTYWVAGMPPLVTVKEGQGWPAGSKGVRQQPSRRPPAGASLTLKHTAPAPLQPARYQARPGPCPNPCLCRDPSSLTSRRPGPPDSWEFQPPARLPQLYI